MSACASCESPIIDLYCMCSHTLRKAAAAGVPVPRDGRRPVRKITCTGTRDPQCTRQIGVTEIARHEEVQYDAHILFPETKRLSHAMLRHCFIPCCS